MHSYDIILSEWWLRRRLDYVKRLGDFHPCYPVPSLRVGQKQVNLTERSTYKYWASQVACSSSVQHPPHSYAYPLNLFIMCIDSNNAAHVTDFVNAQLKSLYKIAGDCIDHYEAEGIDRSKLSGYDFALREYHHNSTASSPAKLEFDEPRVEFVCNHDAILHLTIQNVTVLVTPEPPKSRRPSHTLFATEADK
jgi:hypothetical protein